MTNAGIEAFLIVCKQHSISKAAAELFISQSSLSIRLRTLEKEVGCPLFFRHKGSREMVLTEEGKRFSANASGRPFPPLCWQATGRRCPVFRTSPL